VVFLDYSLPERDGLEVLEEIRRGEAPPPVVMVTGRGDEQVAVKAMKGGAYDYVVKGEGYLQRLPVVAQRAVEAHQLAVERKRAEKALRESEERLRTIVEASLDAIIAVNAEGQLVLFNGAAQELFQYSKEEALNQPANILLREEIGKIHQERLEKFLNTGVGRCGHIGRRMEKLFRRKDGSLFEAEVSMSGGRLDGLRLVVLAIHDITSRKQAEEVLRRTEKNFRLSLDESPLGVRIVTIEGETIYANRAILDIYGYDSIEELKTTPVENRYTPESFTEHQIRREKRKRGVDGPSEYDISIVRKDGEVRHLQVFRKEILWNGERQYQVIYNDITERKRAEETLHWAEERYRKLFEEAPLMYVITRNQGGVPIIADCNRAFLSTLEYTRDEVVGRPLDGFYTPESRAALLEGGYWRALEGSFVTEERRLVTCDGRVIETILTALPETDAQGNITGTRAMYLDITTRKLAEDNLRSSNLEKETLLMEVHHRVKNNMQVISGLLDLQARSSGNPELIAMFHESQSRIQAMSLVHEKLYASKDFARIDLAGYVRALSQDLFQSYKINPGKIDLIVQIDGDVYVDINKAIPCGLILNELISNALKHAFTGDGPGELQIILRETKNTEIEIVVRDNGLGLPDDVDIHQPRSMGLYLVNGLVKKQLEGQIEVRRDNGTEFLIKFPL
jgi:PAS domain S-box-containing protein